MEMSGSAKSHATTSQQQLDEARAAVSLSEALGLPEAPAGRAVDQAGAGEEEAPHRGAAGGVGEVLRAELVDGVRLLGGRAAAVRLARSLRVVTLAESVGAVESLLTQTLIVHVIRTRRIPFVQSRASGAVLATSAAIMAVGVSLPFTRLGGYLGFTALPARYWPYLAATLLGYVALTQAVKSWLLRQRWL